MKTTTNSYEAKVGDVFVASWGYDQVNVDALEVVSVTKSGKSVRVKAIGFDLVGEGKATRVRPKRGSFRNGSRPADPVLKKVKVNDHWSGNGELIVSIKFASYADAYLWDGEETYFDTITAGYPGH